MENKSIKIQKVTNEQDDVIDEKIKNLSLGKSDDIIKEKIALNIDLEKLPEDIAISTMTITCKINTEFYATNIGKYLDLRPNGVVDIRHGNNEDMTTNRTIIVRKVLAQKYKKKKKAFYNQVTLLVKTANKIMNVKLFSNGAIQLTGCKSIESVIEALTKIFKELNIVKAVYDKETNMIVEKQYVTNPKIVDINNLYDIKICMINSNFTMEFNIDRDNLFDLLISDKIECSYDPIIHACVNIKYEHMEKTVSIFVFESGAVIITGARSCEQIVNAYNFINKYLLKHYDVLHKSNNLTNSTILQYLDDN